MYSIIRKGSLKVFHFVSKYKQLFLAVGVLILFSVFSYRIWNASKIVQTPQTTGEPEWDASKIVEIPTPTDEPEPQPQPEPLIYTCCTPLNHPIRTKVFFLKIHKTGSSTVQSILLRFAMTNKLDVMCISYDKYSKPLTDDILVADTRTKNNKYHIFAHHLRYDSKLKSYQYPDTPTITLLRHPATLFQSVYEFFKMKDTTGMTFEQFLKAPVKPQKLTGYIDYFGYKGYNQMSIDLGFDPDQDKNTTAIEQFIEKIDRDFDFVMISEYMDASLILLANLMGWPLEYIVHVNLNVRPKEKTAYNMTEEDISILKELNNVDALLYDHFLKKFQKCMSQYGEDLLKNQIDRFEVINEQFQKKCVAREFVGGLYFGQLKAIEYVPKNPFDLECVYSTQLMPPLSMVAAGEQAIRLKFGWL